MYLIGLHGPDILFYYQPLMKNRVSGLGHQVHQREAAEFFCQAVVKYQEEPTAQMLSYLLGFGCHYILDHKQGLWEDHSEAGGKSTSRYEILHRSPCLQQQPEEKGTAGNHEAVWMPGHSGRPYHTGKAGQKM